MCHFYSKALFAQRANSVQHSSLYLRSNSFFAILKKKNNSKVFYIHSFICSSFARQNHDEGLFKQRHHFVFFDQKLGENLKSLQPTISQEDKSYKTQYATTSNVLLRDPLVPSRTLDLAAFVHICASVMCSITCLSYEIWLLFVIIIGARGSIGILLIHECPPVALNGLKALLLFFYS